MPRQKALKPRRVRKLWHDGLRSLPLINGHRKRYDPYPIDDIPMGQNTAIDVTPDDENNLARILADDKLARRVRQLQKDKYPYGTVPELVIYDFLEREGENFTYQAQLAGGYRAGGLVPDFVLNKNGVAYVLLVQGIYWHNVPGKREKDQGDKLRLLSQYHHGLPVTVVVFIWENRIMQPNPAREIVLNDALVGIEHPQ